MIRSLIALLLVSSAIMWRNAAASDALPCTIEAREGGVVYSAQCYFSRAADALTSAVLIARDDKIPEWAKSYLGNDAKMLFVIVPKDDEGGHYRGRDSDYRAVPGEVVLYRYEDDSFESIGKIERGGGWDKERAQIKAILDKLVAEAK